MQQRHAPRSEFPTLCAFIALVMMWAVLVPTMPTAAQDDALVDDDFDDDDFGDLDIEALMQIDVVNVTSVAGVSQSQFTTPAAISVLTAEDIRRSGHLFIAEALRMVPGAYVGRLDQRQWSVSIRGQSSLFANKLLVLIDGRQVYDPTFAGTYWDIQDMILGDVDRIEIVRGPGATLWGSNAVNGVINIESKSALDTVGTHVLGGVGTADRAFGEFRHGEQVDDDTAFRVWAKYRHHGQSPLLDGTGDRHDDWSMALGGFRMDRIIESDRVLTIDAGMHYSDQLGEGVAIPDPVNFGLRTEAIGDAVARGGHVLARIKHGADQPDGWQVQAYYDRTDRRQQDGLRLKRDTFNIDFRRHNIVGNHAYVIGAAWHHTADSTAAGSAISLTPGSDTDERLSAFIQDTLTIQDDRLFLMLGSKFESNTIPGSGTEVQPSARIWWTPDENQTLWASASRAVRTPDRLSRALNFTVVFTPGAVTIDGDPTIESEELYAYEMGYRVKISDQARLDIAGFYNKYSRLSRVPGATGAFGNRAKGEAYGGEISLDYVVTENWRLSSSYSLARYHEHGTSLGTSEGDAQHQAQIQSRLDLTKDLEFNTGLYYVDNHSSSDAPAYIRLDMGMTWRPAANVEIAVWGQNLLDPQHFEVTQTDSQSAKAEIERGVYAQVSFKF